MKIYIALLFLCIVNTSFAQTKSRTYASSRFALDIAGGGQGLLKPVEKGDTLVYTINKLSDSLLVKKKFNTIPLPPGKDIT